MPIKKDMRVVWLITAFVLAGSSLGQNVTGIWRPWLSHGKLSPTLAKQVKLAKELLKKSSLKLNKDKTFGCRLARRIMMGTWTIKNGVVLLQVKEVVGMSASQVQKLRPEERDGQLKIKGAQLVSLPIKPGQPAMIWKRVG